MAKKAVLIFDVPESCMTCPLEYDCMGCKATGKYLEDTMCQKRPDWCPLKIVDESEIFKFQMYKEQIARIREERLCLED